MIRVNFFRSIIYLLAIVSVLFLSGCIGGYEDNSLNGETRVIIDSYNREVQVPNNVERVVCQGSGALRYLTYLEGTDMVVGVESNEHRDDQMKKPYLQANPHLSNLPSIGEFRGNTDPERIMMVEPDIIFWVDPPSSSDANQLQSRTGIPVVALEYGNFWTYRESLDNSLRLMGEVIGNQERPEEVISFFDNKIDDLNERTADISKSDKESVFIGGVAHRGPHGFQSTQPEYPPFEFLNANNVARDMGTEQAHVSKEAIVDWDPEIIFVDASTHETTPSAIHELESDPSYRSLSAVEEGEVYQVLPYNSYNTNFGTLLANSYYIGTILYPDEFDDIDPDKKADEIYEFLVGSPVYNQISEEFYQGGFQKVSVR